MAPGQETGMHITSLRSGMRAGVDPLVLEPVKGHHNVYETK